MISFSKAAPVIGEACPDAKNTTEFATSAGLMNRLISDGNYVLSDNFFSISRNVLPGSGEVTRTVHKTLRRVRGTWDERIDRHASTDHVLGQPTRQPQERRLGSPVVNHLALDEPSAHTCADQNPAQAFLTTRARMNSLTER